MLSVCRVICSECGCTHALLPSSLIPYSQIPLVCCCQILSDYRHQKNVNTVCNDYPEVDENHVKSVIRRYLLHWRQRILSECIPLSPLRTLITGCFAHYSAQFLQIHRTVNLIHLKTT